MIEDWPDDSTFCPRLRWAAENGEDLQYISMLKIEHEKEVIVLQCLSKHPEGLNLYGLSHETGLDYHCIRRMLIRLRKKTNKIRATKDGRFPATYTLEGSYNLPRFQMPEWSKYR